jgi:hypothetical protein
MKDTRSFSGSFNRISKHEDCKLANHYRGAMREVVGFLDLLASNDPERFVFCSVDAIHQHCKKFQSKELHGKRWVEKVLRELRRRKIISARVQRWRNFRNTDGFLVAPHAAITCRMTNEEGSFCVFMGWGAAQPFAQLPNGSGQLASLASAQAKLADEKPGAAPGEWPGAAPVGRPGEWPVGRADTTQLHASDSTGVDGQIGVLTELSHATARALANEGNVGTAHDATNTGASPASSQSVRACALTNGHDVTKPLGSEVTTGQRFAIKEDIALLQEISDGEYNVYAYKDDITTLAEYTRMVVEEIAGVPWDNQRSTCAGMMDAVAKQMTRDRKEWPAGWLAVIKALRKGGPCHTQYTPPKPAHWVHMQDHEGPPNAQDAKRLSSGDWELCFDWLRRDSAGREAAGYKAKADGVWVRA